MIITGKSAHSSPGAKVQLKKIIILTVKKYCFTFLSVKLYSKERRIFKQKFYSHSVWRRIRKNQLSKYPLCAICEKDHKRTPAVVCDHIEPLKWDDKDKAWDLFIKGPFQSLCKQCHDDKTALIDVPKLIKAERTKIEFFDI